MRCRYREQIYVCGDYAEIDIFPVFHNGQHKSRRRAKYKPTREVQARLNQRNAELALSRLLNANFGEGDVEVTLTYRDEELPPSRDEAERDATNFIRRVKRKRARLGLPEMRYVQIYGGGRHHYHIVMTGGIAREEIERLWGLGWANTKRLAPDPKTGLAGLATYIATQLTECGDVSDDDLFSAFDIDYETGELTERDNVVRKKGKRRWTCSKNLVRPEPEIREGRISARRVEQLATVDTEVRAAWESLYPGYSFAGAMPYHNGENGGYYITVRMVRKKE